ncbi:acetylornithine deacetylase [Anaeromyxobacter diazotrophicus]|uniref:Acetylornithine deacetylase n=1 Tax=Anaeromyxobacter diazotrophicus TaxID=2590199 RepID=A0A7I9VHW3_9BACT|nr:acetylornithine deacetylase [Anaeromyxobacter diazotrophicus]GEJ55710.1 acetylornithine deacetylase [Anaeromyxobacter diazotrophicus]
MDLVPLLQRLVALDSTSSRSNVPVVDLLEELVRPLGFETRRLDWRDPAGVAKTNLVARRGPDAPGGLALVGHTDCVPFDPAWDEALAGTLRDGRVYGRGAADTKGFVACALAAAARAPSHRAPLHLLFTSDEEVGCTGAKMLLAEGRVRPRQAIVGEPTSLVPVRAHKGYCAVDVTVTGVEGHSAFPDLGASAIHAAGRLLAEVARIQEELKDDPDPLFAPPFTTLNVGVIHGGKARNILAGECTFSLEWRPVPGQDPERALRLFDAAGARVAAEGGGRVAVRRTPLRLDDAAVTPAGAELVRFLEAESGAAARSIPFGTELPELIALGAEGCVFGPGDIRVAHRTGEHVPVAELERCTEILTRAIGRFCA